MNLQLKKLDFFQIKVYFLYCATNANAYAEKFGLKFSAQNRLSEKNDALPVNLLQFFTKIKDITNNSTR